MKETKIKSNVDRTLYLECLMSFNTNFKVGMRELDIIEASLLQRVDELSKNPCKNKHAEIAEIRGVLGNLHNQKVWYRPKTSVYIGG